MICNIHLYIIRNVLIEMYSIENKQTLINCINRYHCNCGFVPQVLRNTENTSLFLLPALRPDVQIVLWSRHEQCKTNLKVGIRCFINFK